MQISVSEYIRYATANKLIHNRAWVFSMLGIRDDNTSNEYMSLVDGTAYVVVDGESRLITPFTKGKPLLTLMTPLTLESTDLECLDKDINTTIGYYLINYLLIEKPFNGKLQYIESKLNLDEVLHMVSASLSSGAITVDEYREFVISCTYLEEFNKLVTPSSTEKLMVPPPGLKAFKVKIRKEFITKHGEDWHKDPAHVVAYDNLLKEYYAEYIKDDPSNGIIANGKNKDNALAKKFLTFSTTNAFDEQVHVDGSLSEGYPKDPEKLAGMFNTIRHASYLRGAETQKGGSVAKGVLRATSSSKILPGDCNVKYGITTEVTKGNKDSLIGRYMLVDKKIVNLTSELIDGLIGKSVELRTPGTCKIAKPNYCSICCGDKAAGYPDGISLIVTGISNAMTTAALKAMHNSQISTVKVSLQDLVS